MPGQSRTLTLGVIPARGGSKGLPGKNIRPFCGLALIAHTILYARQCNGIDLLVVSSEDKEILEVAKSYGSPVIPRDPSLAQDDTPIWWVLRSVLQEAESSLQQEMAHVVLLETTSPLRRLGDVDAALERLKQDPKADGIMAVSSFMFNPYWNGFLEGEDGYLEYLVPEGQRAYRRQQARQVYHHSGDFYIWTRDCIARNKDGYQGSKHLFYETPENRAFSIDTQEEFEWAEQLVEKGLVRLPWLENL